jgi:SAM-dependent methyltransferase
MTGQPENAPPPDPNVPVWQLCLGPDPLGGAAYFEGFNGSIPAILRRAPRRVLELGCAAGRMGAFLREKYPGAHCTGIEMNAAAAGIARTRIDRVIEKRLEDIDFAAEGIEPRSIDTFIAGDVLEHLYDPWRALQGILPVLTDDAQVAVSLPNVRNIFIQSQLHNEGTWRYDTHGLLDITHIRFFTFRDIMRMMDETGFVVDDVKCNLDSRYAEIYNANRDKTNITLQLGRVRIENLSVSELQEYCTLQFIVLAHPKARPANDPRAA